MGEPSLYKLKQKKYKDKIHLTDEDTKKELIKDMKVSLFVDNESEEETKHFLAMRWQEMDDSRPDDEWDIRLKQYNADLVWREDGLANTNLPIEFATIRNKIADIQSGKTVVNLIPTEKDDIYKQIGRAHV